MSLNQWTQRLKDNPLALLRAYPVSPPDEGELLQTKEPLLDANGAPVLNPQGQPVQNVTYDPGYVTSSIATDGMFSRYFTGTTGTIPTGDYKQGEVNRAVGNISLDFSGDPRLAGALTFNVKVRPAPDRLACYFLPWANKTLVEMVLPELKAGKTSGPGNPDLFFTAAINGCSVFVTGHPFNPRVGHAGISQGSTAYGDKAAEFWQDLVTAARAARGQFGGKIYSINNTDYCNQTGVSRGNQTRNADDYKRWLDAMPAGEFSVESVSPWGCVFGVRTNRSWAFYLQENVTIKRYRFRRETKKTTFSRMVPKKNIFGQQKGYKIKEYEGDETLDVREDNQVCQTMLVRPFYPAALANKQFLPRFRRV